MPSDIGADTDRPRTDTAPVGWRIPFWALQVLELGVAFLLVTQSVHVRHGAILVVAGAVLAVLALTADGPLGVYRRCGQRLHLVILVGVVVALVVAACIPSTRPDLEGLLVIAFAVVALIVLGARTTTGGGRRRRRRAPGGGEVIDATATVIPAAPEPPAGPAVDPGAPDPDSVLRKAGRTTGAAAAAGRRAVDEHRPAVEDQVKKGLRGAGRLAGRLTAPKSPPSDRA